jgi:hypothetical protein
MCEISVENLQSAVVREVANGPDYSCVSREALSGAGNGDHLALGG